MSLKVGIVGLPNVGKSTLFNSLLKKRVALSANYPFATIEPNTGIVAVPDERLPKLAEITKEEEKMPAEPPIINATVEFVDIAGLVKGASEGAGLGNKFLSHIREVDAIVHVLRDFDDENIVREGSTDPKNDRETIETELALADLQTIEKLIINQEKQSRASRDALEAQKLEILQSIAKELEQGRMIGKYQIGDERLKEWFSVLPLLTIKPILYIFNVDEGSYAHKLEHENVNENEMFISAKIEEELSELSEQERKEYLNELGITEPGLERLIKKAYNLLGLASFLTAGKKEVKAWTFKQGSKAPEAAGVIHTDFIKKFIRAEVIDFEKLVEAGNRKTAKEKGWVRTEGKEYVMKDGDVVEFLIGS
jgi:GTP-binding protein YchF